MSMISQTLCSLTKKGRDVVLAYMYIQGDSGIGYKMTFFAEHV